MAVGDISSAYPSRESGLSDFGQDNHDQGGDASEGTDLFGALWRYRWAVVLPTLLGMLGGFLLFLKTPESFRSSTKLLFETERPAALNSLTGDMIGGVPPIQILTSQLYSDRVVSSSLQSPHMNPFRDRIESNPRGFASSITSGLQFSVDSQGGRSASSMVAVLTFQNHDPVLCEQSVKAFSESLRELFAERHKSSRSELIRLINVGIDQLHPKMTELEDRYRQFRIDAPLVWNEAGKAINPHREQQLLLAKRRGQLSEELRQKSIELSSIEAITKETEDASLALSILAQLLGRKSAFSAVSAATASRGVARDTDLQLAEIDLDQRLIPLVIERIKYAEQFGESHPTVKNLDTELTMMRSEFTRLIKERTDRILELMKESSQPNSEPDERAKQSISVMKIAYEAEIQFLSQQIADLDKQIEDEKKKALALAKFEQEDASLLREIERTRQLINQFEEQMARVSLTEEDSGVIVTELSAPSMAVRIGPNLSKSLSLWSVVGLALGCVLAFLLEKNANTFRTPDEIVAAIGVPILTHLPFFKGKIRKSKKDALNPFEKLDPYLAVVHQPASVPAEAIRSCRTSIFFDLSNINGGKIIQVTSPLPGDGKSTVAGNLACSIAQSGKKTLLIDCDLRRPQITDNFDSADKLGLIDVLNGHCEHVEAMHETPLATLKMMPSGPIPANPAEALTLTEMSELLELLRDEFDYIIVDTPPLLVVTDPSILASMVDAVVMTLKIRRKSKPNLKEAAGILRTVGARLIGVVINNSDESGSSDGYKGYGYYRYGRHTNRYYRKTAENGVKAGQPRTPIVVSGRTTGLRATAAAAKPISVATSNSTNGTPTDDV